MRIKKRWLAALALVLAVASLSGLAQGKKHRVVVAVSSKNEADWSLALGNIRNLKKGLAPEPVEVEVVAFGPGIAMVKKDSPVAADIQALLQDGVVFVGCENAMRHSNLTKADLVSGTGTVPAGIVEVVKKQEEGWVYIKGGQ
jgi:intracellular sulfur oxidation DsrE/DsrF family protein